MIISRTHYASGEEPRIGDLAIDSNPGTQYLLESWPKAGLPHWRSIAYDGRRMSLAPGLPGHLRLVSRVRGTRGILDRPALLDRLAHAEREWRSCRMWSLAVAIVGVVGIVAGWLL